MDLERLKKQEELILNWATDKGILDKGTPMAQAQKTIEEVIELKVAHITNNKAEVLDSIGDIFVTVAIQSKMQGFNIFDLCDYKSIPKLGKRDNSGFVIKNIISESISFLDELVLEGEDKVFYMELSLSKIISNLIVYCKTYNIDIHECIDLAYSVISKRSGKMVGGTFVKNK